MKTTSIIRGAHIAFLVIVSFILSLSNSAQAYTFNRAKLAPNCSLTAEQQREGYRILPGRDTFYSGASCWNGTSQGACVRAIVEPNTLYVCVPTTVSGRRGYRPLWKQRCGNQIDVIEDVEVPYQQQGYADSNWQDILLEAASFFQGLVGIAQQYGYGSYQYQQGCAYVQQHCAPEQAATIITKTNVYIDDHSINGSLNKTVVNPKDKQNCPPITNQTGTGPIVDSGNSRDPVKHPVGNQAAKQLSASTPDNPTGKTGRNGSAVTLAQNTASTGGDTNNSRTPARARKGDVTPAAGIANAIGQTGRNKATATLAQASPTQAGRRAAKASQLPPIQSLQRGVTGGGRVSAAPGRPGGVPNMKSLGTTGRSSASASRGGGNNLPPMSAISRGGGMPRMNNGGSRMSAPKMNFRAPSGGGMKMPSRPSGGGGGRTGRNR